MRAWILSDLHLNFSFWEASPPEADVAIVAGDVYEGAERSMRWLGREIFPHMPVVYVLGNHEFYNSNIQREIDIASRAARENGIIWLNDDVYELHGVRLIGGTLWTDYCLYGSDTAEMSMRVADRGLNDHRLVTWGPEGRRFAPAKATHLHQRTRQFLADRLAEPFDGKTVIVTHHVPHRGSIDPKYLGSPLNPAFASDLSDLIEHGQPDLWVHGHTHSFFDYHVGKTRIVCNPRGYPGERPDFDPGFVIEI